MNKKNDPTATPFWYLLHIIFPLLILITIVISSTMDKENTRGMRALSMARKHAYDIHSIYELNLMKGIARGVRWEGVGGEDAPTIEPAPEVERYFTKDEIDLMARVVMSEASILPYEAKQAVAEVILNRLDDPQYPNTVLGVVIAPHAFSTADNGIPTDDCYNAVYAAITYRAYPRDMLWFVSDTQPNYGYKYYIVENTIFTTKTDYHVDGIWYN